MAEIWDSVLFKNQNAKQLYLLNDVHRGACTAVSTQVQDFVTAGEDGIATYKKYRSDTSTFALEQCFHVDSSSVNAIEFGTHKIGTGTGSGKTFLWDPRALQKATTLFSDT